MSSIPNQVRSEKEKNILRAMLGPLFVDAVAAVVKFSIATVRRQ